MKNFKATIGLSGMTVGGVSMRLITDDIQGVAVFQDRGKRGLLQVSKWYQRKGNAINKMIEIIEFNKL
jgi:hypothetical protein